MLFHPHVKFSELIYIKAKLFSVKMYIIAFLFKGLHRGIFRFIRGGVSVYNCNRMKYFYSLESAS